MKTFWAGLVLVGSGVVAWGQTQVGELPEASFRMVLGVRDTQPAAWDGHVEAGAGQRVELEADRFRDHQYEEKSWAKGIVSVPLPDPVLPNDGLRGSLGWVASTRWSPLHGPTTEWHDFGQINAAGVKAVLKPVLLQPSVLVHVRSGSLDEAVTVVTVKGTFRFVPREILRSGVGEFLDGGVKVTVAPVQAAVAAERLGQQDFPVVLEAGNGTMWVAWQEYDGEGDRVVVRSRSGGKWGAVAEVESGGDVFRPVLAEDAGHRVWVVWSMQVKGRWDLYARVFAAGRWGERQRLTSDGAVKNVYHAMTSDSDGRVWLVWQRMGEGASQIVAKSFFAGKWSAEERISSGASAGGDNWWPVVAAGPKGMVAVAWDGYAAGSYDVYLRRRVGGKWGAEEAVTRGAGFEAHPTVAVDARSRVWVAWDRSGANWGTEVGFLRGKVGTPLHASRGIGMVCVEGEKRLTTREDVASVLGAEGFWELPHLQMGADGKPWLLVRRMVMREPDTPLEDSNNLALWEEWATRYDGEQWGRAVYVPHSAGRNDMMPASAADAVGNVWAVWATDGRDTKDYQPQQQQVRVGELVGGEGKEMSLVESSDAPGENIAALHSKEAEEVARVRAYRIAVGGKTYSIYRGDMHRHTDISVDGNNDGSLLDAYRYAKDAAALDFVAVTNHTDDIWDKYNWWRTQKVADLFNVDGAFVDFYAYERSVEWPNGHRNIFFTQRGAPILPIGAFEARAGYAGSGTLYGYLHRYGGFSIPHTTGRTSGTDWRDNDPAVESVMEVYQGMRDSYEYPASPRPFALYGLPDAKGRVPRASSSPDSPSFKKLGFAWNALEKGYHLGFIASSDHISTHVSYACLLAEKLTREDLAEAIKERRTYAATDNIVLDVRFAGSDGEHLMGAIFASGKPLRIDAKVLGTGELLQVDVVKDSAVVKTWKPGTASAELTFTDSSAMDAGKEHWFYVRVMQKDGEMAWSSPVWVTYGR
ncbi:MAG: hypothetical protein V4555_10750 [Acidobacteriota bacterium]